MQTSVVLLCCCIIVVVGAVYLIYDARKRDQLEELELKSEEKDEVTGNQPEGMYMDPEIKKDIHQIAEDVRFLRAVVTISLLLSVIAFFISIAG